MNTDQTALARKQLERRLASLRDVAFAPPRGGWMRAIRESLGMNARQLAARMGVAPSRVPAIEKAEGTGATTIKTLREAAAALNCTFVYAFVPVKPLDELLRDQARQKAAEDLSRLDHTMRLENQALLPSDLEDERERMAQSLLTGSLRGLWDDERDRNA